jgi:hypothetical protein
MIDEELADSSFRSKKLLYKASNNERTYIDGFLAGLEAGRSKWHDLRKDPKDLPEPYTTVLDQDGVQVIYDYNKDVWRTDDADNYTCDTPIAWCEKPTFNAWLHEE